MAKALLLALLLCFAASAQAQSRRDADRIKHEQTLLDTYRESAFFDIPWLVIFNDSKMSYAVVEALFAEKSAGLDIQKLDKKLWGKWRFYQSTRLGRQKTDGSFLYQDEALGNLSQFKADQSRMPASNFTFIGQQNSVFSSNNGRIERVNFHPTNSNIVWASAPEGGLWRSNDAGDTWTSQGDFWEHLSVGDLVYDLNNTNIIYVATDDHDSWFNENRGVLRSDDGGATWNIVGLPNSQAQNIYKLAMHPDGSTLFACTNEGLFKSTDQGVTWVKNAALPAAAEVNDLEFQPGNSQVMYVTLRGGGSPNYDYFYTSADGGATFALVAAPMNSKGRTTQICVSPNDPDVAFIGIYPEPPNYTTTGGMVMKYVRSSNTLSIVTQPTYQFPNIWVGGAWDFRIELDPANASHIIYGCVFNYESFNGGATWAYIPSLHADVHDIKWQPNTNKLWIADDGGLGFSTNAGANWTTIENLPVMQFYSVRSSKNGQSKIMGAQDAGVHLDANGAWFNPIGGDGLEVAVDPVDESSRFYGSIQQGLTIERVKYQAGSANAFQIMNQTLGGGEATWRQKIVIDAADRNTIFTNYFDVLKSADGGASWVNLTNGTLGNGSTALEYLVQSKSNPQVLVAGLGLNNMWRTTDGGATWAAIAHPGIWVGNQNTLVISPTDPDKMWAAGWGQVKKTTDGGATWTDFTGSLPWSANVGCIAYQEGTADGLYVGGRFGQVFYRDNSTGDWVAHHANLPNAWVTEVEALPHAGKVRAATWGRGVWESPVHTASTGLCIEPAPPVVASDFCGSAATLSIAVAPSGYSIIWDKNGATLAGETSTTLAVSTSGNYRARYLKNSSTSCHSYFSDAASIEFRATPAVLSGNGLHLDGSNDYVEATSEFDLIEKSFSIEFWAKRESAGGHDFVASMGLPWHPANKVLHIGFRSNNQFTFDFNGNGLNVASGYSDLAWHHWACVYDKSIAAPAHNRFVYRDGVLVASDRSASDFLGLGKLNIGRAFNSHHFPGNVDELKIWSEARTQAQIAAGMFCAPDCYPQSLQIYLPMNEGTANGDNSALAGLTDYSSHACKTFFREMGLNGSTSNLSAGVSVNTFFEDADGDGFGNAAAPLTSCPTGAAVTNALDCDDANASANPNAAETCGNLLDDNCNGQTDEKTLSLHFDGGADSVRLSNTLGNFGTSDFSIELKIKTTATSKKILGKRPVCNCATFWNLNLTSAGKLEMEMMQATTNGSCSGITYYTSPLTSQAVNDGNWHHVAIVREGTNLKIYLDGVVDVANGYAPYNLNNSHFLLLGNSICGGNGFVGEMDELRFWNHARTATEVNFYKNASLSGTENGLLAYYDFDNQNASPGGSNGTVTALADRSGNGHNGTLHNFALTGTTGNWLGNPNNLATLYADADGDGFGDASASTTGCSQAGYVSNASDCNDANDDIFPGASETCGNNVDDDCDTEIDEGCAPPCNVAITSIAPTHETCPGANNGALSIAATGAANLEYSINGTTFQTGNIFSNLADGAYTVTVRDASNTTCTATGNSTINAGVDNTPPTIACPANQTVAANSSCGGTVGTRTAASSSDNCGTPTVSQSPAAATILSGHDDAETVTLTANDGNGNTATCSFSVTLKDQAAPTIACPANQTVTANSSCQGTVGVRTLASKSDNCTASGSITESQSPASSTVLSGHNAVQTVTLTANDGNGNTANCSFTVTLKDVTPPTASCQNVTVQLNGSGTASLAATQVDNGSSDNCGVASRSVNTTSFNCANLSSTASNNYALDFDGTNDYLLVPHNANQNLGTNFTLELWFKSTGATSGFRALLDKRSAASNYTNFSMAVNGGTAATMYINNASGNSFTSTANAFVAGNWYHYAVTYNGAQLKQYVNGTLIATTNTSVSNPLLSEPIQIGRAAFGGEYFAGQMDEVRIWNVARTATQINATKNIMLTGSEANLIAYYSFENGPGSSIATDVSGHGNNATLTNMTPASDWVAATNGVAGITTSVPVTLTVTDAANNSSTCNASITVQDVIPPTVTCPANISVNTASNTCANTATWTAPTGADNCSVASTTGSRSPGTTFNLGATTVTYTTTDGSGNTGTCAFTVTVTDNILPTISCPVNVTVAANSSCQGTVGARTATSLSDNCGTPTVSQSPAASTILSGHNAVQVVTLTATDAASNSATCSFTVTLKDQTAPTIACPTAQIVAANSSCGGTVGSFSLVSKTDNCTASGSISESQSTSGDGNLSGHNDFETVTLTANDGNGNAATCSFTVTLKDQTSPTIVCPANQTVAANASCAGTVGAYVLVSKTDNCAASGSISESQSNSGDGNLSGHDDFETVTLTATDGGSNTATCSFTVTLKDQTLPTVTCPANQTVVPGGSGNYVLADFTSSATASDNCGTPTKTQSPAEGVSLPPDSYTISITATDAAANSGVCTFNLTVQNLSNTPAVVLAFDGTNDWVDMAATVSNLPIGAAQRTVEAWVKTSQTTIGNFVSWGTRASNQRVGVAVRSGKAAFIGQVADVTGVATINDNVWHHVAFTYDGSRVRLYVDGVLDITSGVMTLNTVGQNLRLGKISSPDNTEFFNGRLEDVRIWNYARTQAEIAADMDNELQGNETGLLVYYKFNQGFADGSNPTETTLFDEAGSGDGALTGFALTGANSNWTAPGPAGLITCSVAITSIAPTHETCPGANDGSLTIAATGAANLEYSLDGSTFQASDVFENLADGSYTVTVRDASSTTCAATGNSTVNAGVDNAAPTIACPAAQTVTANSSCEGTVGAYVLVSKTDNCAASGSISESQSNSGDGNLSGHDDFETVTLAATDDSGNTATCSFSVTLKDQTAPTAACQNLTVQLDNTGNANTTPAAVGNGSGDACGTVNLSLSKSAFSCADLSSAGALRFDGMDDHVALPPIAALDNASQVTLEARVTMNVLGAYKPIFTKRVSETVNLQLQTSAAGNKFAVNISNGSDGFESALTTTIVAGQEYFVSMVFDGSLAENQRVKLYVNGVAEPLTNNRANPATTPNIPATPIYLAREGAVYSNVKISELRIWSTARSAAQVAANAGGELTGSHTGLIANYRFNQGTASGDNAGMTILQDAVGSFSGTLSNFALNGSTSNWVSGFSGGGSDGYQVVALTADDNNGNTSSCAATITVVDNAAPTIACPAAQIVAANSSCGGTVGTWAAASSSDNCSAPTVSQSPAASTILSGHDDAETVTLTANDGNGNTATCSFTVTLKDQTAPTAPASLSAVNANCSATPAAPTALDNCAGMVAGSSNVPFPITALGTTTITWTFDDGNGNTSTATQNVVVVCDQDNDGSYQPADCDDANAAIHPGAAEIASDGIDQNCDGAELCYKDFDNDGYRPNATATLASADMDCDDSSEALASDPTGDCADADAARFPGNPEICDGKDNDCANGVPYTEADADGDGFRICQNDCNDASAAINPGAPEFVCNQLDDDCDGQTDEGTDATPPTAVCKTNYSIILVGGAASVTGAQLNNGSSDACSGTTLSFSIISGATSYTCASIAASPLALVLQVADPAGNTSTCAASVSVADALVFSETGRRNASDGLAGDRFGWGTALDGNTAIGSAPEAKVGTQGKQGAAYLFNGAASWAQFKKLTASDGAATDYFGIALALDGTMALAGTYGDNVGANNDQGSAYLFYKDLGGANNWGEAKKLTASDGAGYEYFGLSVALKNGFALVGANKAKIGTASARGAAYIFQKDLGGADNWGQAKKLTASDGAANNFFGAAVSLNADASLALVGANGNLSNRGAAYLFGKDTGGAGNWGQIGKWTASDGATGDGFGTSLSLSGNYAIVGAPNKASYTGAAYVFKNTGSWAQAKKLTASDGAAGNKFGASVAISGEYAYVGAPVNAGKGAVYVFQKDQGGADNWGQIGKWTASDGAANDQYGFSLAVAGTTAVVGANLDDISGKADQGSMYVLDGALSCGGGMAAPGDTRAAQNLENQLDLRCSPNPFSDELSIEVSASDAVHLTVTDATGRAVASVDLPAGAVRFDLRTGDFPPGLYFVRVADGAGHVRVVPVARVR